MYNWRTTGSSCAAIVAKMQLDGDQLEASVIFKLLGPNVASCLRESSQAAHTKIWESFYTELNGFDH